MNRLLTGIVFMLSSFMAAQAQVESDPVGAIAGFGGFGVNFNDLSLAVAPPGVVPAGSHVKVESMAR